MACHKCEQRRVEMRLMVEASTEWVKNPTGPGIPVILARLREEAMARGELDRVGAIRPHP